MRTREIRDEIIELISDKVGIDKDRLYHYGKDKSLLDASIGLQPRDMLTLFFDLQRKYRISFAESDIIEKRFDFLDNIVDAIIDKQVSY